MLMNDVITKHGFTCWLNSHSFLDGRCKTWVLDKDKPGLYNEMTMAEGVASDPLANLYACIG